MGGQIRTDATLARLADRQHGVVGRRQLLAAGVSARAVDGRLRRGWLVPLHRGVYAVGHRRLTDEGRWLAAVLAAGPRALLSHRDAAALHGLRPLATSSRKVSVTTTRDVAGTSALRVHSRRSIATEDRAVAESVPVTSVARTLVDLAPMLTAAQLASTLGEADRRGLLDVAAVERALARVRQRHGQGHRRLRAALDAHSAAGATLTRSALEERFLDLVIAANLPRPRLNAHVAGCEVDALWPAERVVVELDGWAHHSGREAARRDRGKTNRLQSAGYVALRFLHADLVEHPAAVADEIAAVLSLRV